jgi:hypothetical protein
MFFKDLPDEISLIIFNKTLRQDQARLAQVDKHCNEVVHDKTLDLDKYKKEKLPIELKKAVLSKNLGKIKLFLSMGADPNYIYDAPQAHEDEPWLAKRKRTLLDLAICSGSYEVASLLIENKADINIIIVENDDSTLLHTAAFWLRAKIAKLLIDKGANIEAINGFGKIPADYADQGYSLGDHATEKVISTLVHSLRTNKDWDQALAAEEHRNSYRIYHCH